jgi:hypothetical protein
MPAGSICQTLRNNKKRANRAKNNQQFSRKQEESACLKNGYLTICSGGKAEAACEMYRRLVIGRDTIEQLDWSNTIARWMPDC